MNSLPGIREVLAPKLYVNNAINETTLVGNVKNNDFNNISSSNRSHIAMNSQPVDDNHAATEAYVDSSSETDRNRRDLPFVFKDQDKVFDKKKLKVLGKITGHRYPTSNDEIASKNYVVDSLGEGYHAIPRFNQT